MRRRQFPRTELSLQILRQELAALEVMSGKLPEGMSQGEIYRSKVLAEAIDEFELLLEVGRGWAGWQWLLLGLVFSASLFLGGVALWILIMG